MQLQLSVDGLSISGLEVRVLRGSPLLKLLSALLLIGLPSASGAELRTSENKTPPLALLPSRCESGTAWVYTFTVVSRLAENWRATSETPLLCLWRLAQGKRY